MGQGARHQYLRRHVCRYRLQSVRAKRSVLGRGSLNDGFTLGSWNWPGVFLDDEVDGRFAPELGVKELESVKEKCRDNGQFMYANYTPSSAKIWS